MSKVKHEICPNCRGGGQSIDQQEQCEACSGTGTSPALTSRAEFMALPRDVLAELVGARNIVVCFPINGTRRWFTLEHGGKADFNENYIDTIARRHVEIYRLFFDHGMDTLLTPVFGSELLNRGEEYMQLAAEGLSQLATSPIFTNFYRECDVRARFYGDYRRFFGPTPYAYLIDLFDSATAETAGHSRYRLLIGVCANDATEMISELSVQYFQTHGYVPERRALVEMYYGEYIAPVSLFIGFSKFNVFDMPLLALGDEDLYFTVSPSLYITEQQLRTILYDHLFARRVPEPDYAALSPEAWERMRTSYRRHRKTVLGIGMLRDGIWYPLLVDEPVRKT
ncbi:MAG: diterpene synthase [Anaerolineae bacterium]|nr:diterpene synthase [Anaerolineae bacterium]